MADYSNSKYEVYIISDCLFKVIPFEGIELDDIDVREMREVYLRFSKNNAFAILLDATNNFTPTQDARKLLASKEYAEKRIAAAFVTKTLANKIFGNFFINFNKPHSPTKLFTDEESALAWLREQMKNYM